MKGASVSDSGTLTFIKDGYLPLNSIKKFKVACTYSKISPVIEVTVTGTVCDIQPKNTFNVDKSIYTSSDSITPV